MSEIVQTKQRETMNSAEVAEFLHMCINLVRRHAKDGKIPAYRIPGTRKYVFYRDEIEDALIPEKDITTD